jgi:nicotinamidase-related amidase
VPPCGLGGGALSLPALAAGLQARRRLRADRGRCAELLRRPAARCRGKGAEVVPVINKLAAAFDNIVVTQDWHTRATPRLPAAPGQKPFQHQAQLRPPGAVARPLRAGHRGRRAAQDLKLPTAQVIIRKGFHKDVDSYSAFEEADRKTTTGLAGYLEGARHQDRSCHRPGHRLLRGLDGAGRAPLGFRPM